jgi:hypothetical protein
MEGTKKVIGFLTNKLTLRGTEIAMFDYADYKFNKVFLLNKYYKFIF